MDFQHIIDFIMPMLQNFLSAVAVPFIIAFIKSELMALDGTTTANGIVHYFKLANQALTIVKEVKSPNPPAGQEPAEVKGESQ